MIVAGFSDKALQLILDAEGIDQPSEWPGGASGITCGIGYDLGYESNFAGDWHSAIPDTQISRLQVAVGVRGQSARDLAPKFKDIRITRQAAYLVFEKASLPKYIRMTRVAYPGFDALPLDAQGALVSLVYNRGTSTAGERRSEMRDLVPAVKSGNLQTIANLIRRMKRLWEGTGQGGLVTRRENEARLVESCIGATPPV